MGVGYLALMSSFNAVAKFHCCHCQVWEGMAKLVGNLSGIYMRQNSLEPLVEEINSSGHEISLLEMEDIILQKEIISRCVNADLELSRIKNSMHQLIKYWPYWYIFFGVGDVFNFGNNSMHNITAGKTAYKNI